jgi:lysozyme
MRGQDVKAMQGLLNARFHELHRDRYRIKVDGVTDPRSRRRRQALPDPANRHGAKLPVTGSVDDKTYARLLKPIAPPTQVLASPARAPARRPLRGRAALPVPRHRRVPTQGYGHTAGVHIGERCWTHAKALRVLHADLDKFSKGVTRIVHVGSARASSTRSSPGRSTSGLGAAGGSTLIRELNQRHYANAGNQFKVWNKAGGRPVWGLTLRRRGECRLYWKGVSAPIRRRIRC